MQHRAAGGMNGMGEVTRPALVPRLRTKNANMINAN
jgi:hypothetical protein